MKIRFEGKLSIHLERTFSRENILSWVYVGSVCVWDYNLPFSLMIGYLMKSSERDVFKYGGGGGGGGGGMGEF